MKFNGRLSFKQFIPMKPDKFGIKVWMLVMWTTNIFCSSSSTIAQTMNCFSTKVGVCLEK